MNKRYWLVYDYRLEDRDNQLQWSEADHNEWAITRKDVTRRRQTFYVESGEFCVDITVSFEEGDKLFEEDD